MAAFEAVCNKGGIDGSVLNFLKANAGSWRFLPERPARPLFFDACLFLVYLCFGVVVFFLCVCVW